MKLLKMIKIKFFRKITKLNDCKCKQLWFKFDDFE